MIILCPSARKAFIARVARKHASTNNPWKPAAAVSACLEAYRATGDDRWLKEAWSAFNWFLGDNDLQIALYDPIYRWLPRWSAP